MKGLFNALHRSKTFRDLSEQEFSWVLYDVGNSAYTMLACSLIPIWFKSLAIGTAPGQITGDQATAYYSISVSIVTVIVALLGPICGALADHKDTKKIFFTTSVALGCVSCIINGFAMGWVAFLVIYVLCKIFFQASLTFYDSMLNDITTEERMDRVSTLGYGLGYIGGSTIPLVLSLLLIQFGDAIGIGTMLATRISFLLTAGWWLVFTLPMLRHVHQKHGIDPERNIVLHTLRNVKDTCCMILKNKSVVFFIIAYFFYIDGVGTIIHMATVFGDSCGLGSMDMMVVLLVVQIVAFPFAILYGKLAERFGSRTMILTGIATYIVVCFVAFRLSTLRDFLILAVLVGTAQGGIQALSRSFFGKLVPQESASEYFGFFDVFGKFSAVIGPTLFGIVAQATGVSRYGILPVLGMFILGGVIMAFVVPKNIQRIH